MLTETRTIHAKARLVLPKSFANATVIMEQVSETEIRVRRTNAVTETTCDSLRNRPCRCRTGTATGFGTLGKPAGADRGSQEGGGPPQGPPFGPVMTDRVVEPFHKHHDKRKCALAPPLDDPLHLFLPVSTVEDQLG